MWIWTTPRSGLHGSVIRFTQILIAMALILLAGVLGARQLEERMGVSAVPGLVLLDCPDLGAGSLDELAGSWAGATLEWVPAGSGPFLPFDPQFVARHVNRGDATALFSTAILDREAAAVSAWRVILDGFPGDRAEDRAEEATGAVVGFLGRRSGSRPFVVGVSLERNLPDQAIARTIERLVEAAKAYPESRRTAVVVLGAQDQQPIAGLVNRRWCLRIPIGDWSRLSQADLRDLLEGASVRSGATR
jgi:hypothetical protein